MLQARPSAADSGRARPRSAVVRPARSAVGSRQRSARVAPLNPASPTTPTDTQWKWPWGCKQDVPTPLTYIGRALYDFEAAEDGELAMKKGEEVYVIARAPLSLPKGWLVAHKGSGPDSKKGLVPESYLAVVRPLKRPTVAAFTGALAELQTELQNWRGDTPLEDDNAKTFAEQLRRIAAWLSPKDEPRSPPEGVAQPSTDALQLTVAPPEGEEEEEHSILSFSTASAIAAAQEQTGAPEAAASDPSHHLSASTLSAITAAREAAALPEEPTLASIEAASEPDDATSDTADVAKAAPTEAEAASLTAYPYGAALAAAASPDAAAVPEPAEVTAGDDGAADAEEPMRQVLDMINGRA